MRVWVITSLGSSVKEFITAKSRKDAISFYCAQNGMGPSSYLKCRRATASERIGG